MTTRTSRALVVGTLCDGRRVQVSRNKCKSGLYVYARRTASKPAQLVRVSASGGLSAVAAKLDVGVGTLPSAIVSVIEKELRSTVTRELGQSSVRTDQYEIALGTCLTLLASIAASSVAAVICDPPYGNTKGSSTSDGYNRQWDVAWSRAMWQDTMAHFWRVLQPGGHLLLFCQGQLGIDLVVWLMDKTTFYYDIIWVHADPGGGTYNRKWQPGRSHERILVLYKRTGHSGNSLYQPSTDTVANGSVIDVPKKSETFKVARNSTSAKNMKPVALLQALVSRFVPEGGCVLDPCMNSGVCGVAALSMQRKFIGFEAIDKRYQIACQWLASCSS